MFIRPDKKGHFFFTSVNEMSAAFGKGAPFGQVSEVRRDTLNGNKPLFHRHIEPRNRFEKPNGVGMSYAHRYLWQFLSPQCGLHTSH